MIVKDSNSCESFTVYDEVFDIIKGKHKAKPVRLLDSLSREVSPTLTTSKKQPATNAPNSSRQSIKTTTNIRTCNTESENASSDKNDLNGSPFIYVKSSTKPKKPGIDNTCILQGRIVSIRAQYVLFIILSKKTNLNRIHLI